MALRYDADLSTKERRARAVRAATIASRAATQASVIAGREWTELAGSWPSEITRGGVDPRHPSVLVLPSRQALSISRRP